MSLSIGKPIRRSSSLECTCEYIKLSSYGGNNYIFNKCDFCSEKEFVKSVKGNSIPSLSIFNM